MLSDFKLYCKAAAAAAAKSLQSCPTLSDPMDCSLPGSSVHGIFQAKVLEWGAIAFYSNQNSMVLAQTHTHRLIEQNRQPMNLSKLWETVKDRGDCKSWT